MAKKPTITEVSSGFTSQATLNANLTALRDAFENTLSRDGSTPNSMEADLDMNSNDVLNAGRVETDRLLLNGVPVSTTLNELTSIERSTFAELSSVPSSEVAVGDYVGIKELGADYQRAEDDASDVVGALDFSGSGGLKYYINRGKYDLRAEDFGVKFTGSSSDATANATAIQSILDWLHSEGQGGCITLGSDGHMTTDLPMVARDGVSIDGRGCLIENTRSSDISSGYSATSCYVAGLFAKADGDNFTFATLGAIAQGTDIITPASTTGHQVGDLIMVVDADNTLGTSSFIPVRMRVSPIVEISGGNIKLLDPIDFAADAGSGTLGSSADGAWFANVSYRVNSGDDTGLVDGRHWVKNNGLYNVRLQTAFGPPIRRTGMYNANIDGVEFVDSPYGVYLNGFANSIMRNVKGSYYTRGFELAIGSHNSIIENFNLSWRSNTTDQSDPPELPMNIGEGARSMIVRDGVIDAGAATVYSGTASSRRVMTFNRSEGCTVDTVKFKGRVPNLPDVIRFNSDASGDVMTNCTIDCGDATDALINFGGTNNQMTNCKVYGTGTNDNVSFASGIDGGIVAGNEFTTDGNVDCSVVPTSNPKVSNNKGVSLFTPVTVRRITANGNTSSAWEDMAEFFDDVGIAAGDAVTSTSEVIIGDVIVIPSGTLNQGDKFTFKVSGTKSGSAGTANLKYTVAVDTDDDGASLDVDDDQNVAFDETIASNATDWEAEVGVFVTTGSTVILSAKFTDLANGTVSGDVQRVTGFDQTNHDVRFELSGSVTSGDTLTIREVLRTPFRYGMG